MENNEYPYKGLSINGFIMLFFQLLLALLIMALILILGWIVPAAILSLIWVFLSSGYIKQEPNESRVLVFFGKYSGTYRKVGFNLRSSSSLISSPPDRKVSSSAWLDSLS